FVGPQPAIEINNTSVFFIQSLSASGLFASVCERDRARHGSRTLTGAIAAIGFGEAERPRVVARPAAVGGEGADVLRVRERRVGHGRVAAAAELIGAEAQVGQPRRSRQRSQQLVLPGRGVPLKDARAAGAVAA